MKAVEYFCGAGGTSLGLKAAGIRVCGAFDNDYAALRTYRHNLKRAAWHADARDIFRLGRFFAQGPLDIIVGSPPCQDFSKIGKRKEEENARLTHAFAMLVAVARHEWILMENVPEAATSKTWREARELIRRQGYGLTETILDASFYGVPQARKRLIVVGRLGERDGFLSSALADAASEKPMTVREILSPEIEEDRRLLEVGHLFLRPFTDGRGVRSIDEPCTTVVRTTGDGPGPKYLRNPHPRDPIPATEAHVPTREQISRIQGFPIGWDWSPTGNARKIHQAIANAVPPALAEAVGRVIVARHRGESIPAVEDGFVEWLCRYGKSVSVARNVKANLNRARRLLRGRTFADSALEIARLEMAEGFGTLPRQTQSDLRAALRLYAEWGKEQHKKTVRRRKPITDKYRVTKGGKFVPT